MTLEIQSIDIGHIGSHKFYRPINDLENIKANMPNVPDLRDKLMFLSRIMFQDALHNQIGSNKPSVVKFDLDKFIDAWNIDLSNPLYLLPHNEVREFIKKHVSKTVANQLEFNIFKNKRIFQILYGLDDDDLPVNCMQHILSPVSFRAITYMKYVVPDIFEKTKWSEAEYENAFSTTTGNSRRHGPDKLVEMVDDLFDNVMESILPYYDKEAFLSADQPN